MEFVLHKDWMFEMDRFSYVYREGVADFLRYAKHNTSDEIFPCPCIKCNNGSNQSSELIELHLIQWGIRKDYTLWDFHGETNESPYVPKRLENEESVHTHEGLEPPPLLNALINDAFGIHGLPPNEYEDSGCPPMQDDFLNNDKEYIRLKGDAMRPLYPDCKANQTTLYAIVGLHNLKSHFGLSGKAITGILQWVKDLLPKKNTLPDNYPHLKNCLKGLGMKYKSIHACKYDCILYRNEHKSKLKCPVCEEPRFVIDRDLRGSLKLGDTKAKPFASIPQKVLKYFPTAPRLKRLYTIPWIAEAMTWHSRAECGENLMRHPIDSIVWKNANLDHPDFASESRNVRLGLSTDGFNPHGNLATNKSVWPVILVPYNLPPSLCMKKEFSMLSLLIPGPKAPSDDIDVFLAPLVEELNDLWVNGTIAFDSFKQEEFTLKAMLLWAIHDFPAYGTLSGCNTHGYFACPVCGEETESEWLQSSSKICYHTHRRFLPLDHKFRSDKRNFLPEGIENRPPPMRLSGLQTEANASMVKQDLRGKHPKFVARKRKEKAECDKAAWSRRSILFDLPYWRLHKVRHVIDIMHAEKNIIEHIINTCIDGVNSKDGLKAREDLQIMKVKKKLWMKDGKIPTGDFRLSNEERKVFLDTLFELKVPSNFSSNLRRVVNYPTQDLRRLKSHDWHVIMQLAPLLFKHCFSKHVDLRRAIMQISLCFTLICEKVVNREHIMAAKLTLVEATCILEKYFPCAFFDISIHLLVHLCEEALLCGPVRYRWMYPFERLMKVFKGYVKNQRYICGSIAEGYITDESAAFSRNYMPTENDTRDFYIDEYDDLTGDEVLGKGKTVRLSNMQHAQVTRYVFDAEADVDKYKEEYDSSQRLKKQNRGQSSHDDFRLWVLNKLESEGDFSSRSAMLANGPSFKVREFGRCRANGFVFSSQAYEDKLVAKQNSGVSLKALTPFRASWKDKKLREVEVTHYGVIQQILELDYTSFKVVVFYCDWVRVEDKSACKIDLASNLILVDLKKLKSKHNLIDEPFVCAFQRVKQVFYSKYINNEPWFAVLNSRMGLTASVDSLEAPVEFQSAFDDNPHLLNFLD